MEDVVLIPDAARELGISRQTLWRHVNRGHLPARKIGRDFVIDRKDLARFQAERQKTPGRPRKAVEHRPSGDHGVTARPVAAERAARDA